MLDPEIRRKLSKVNRERSADQQETAPVEMKLVSLHEALPGQVYTHELGEFFICSRKIEDFLPERREKILDSIQIVRSQDCEPEEAIFLDIETCGLANCPLFLVGTMCVQDGEIRVDQFFARDYSEEPTVLSYMAELLSRYKMLVTFNGKTFDVPYMRDRMIFHRLRYKFQQKHIDLLPIARMMYRGVFPNCKLQTLEERLCGRRRYGDTPGSLIPELYHGFVRTGNASPIEGIFHHNALDLITMAELLPYLLR